MAKTAAARNAHPRRRQAAGLIGAQSRLPIRALPSRFLFIITSIRSTHPLPPFAEGTQPAILWRAQAPFGSYRNADLTLSARVEGKEEKGGRFQTLQWSNLCLRSATGMLAGPQTTASAGRASQSPETAEGAQAAIDDPAKLRRGLSPWNGPRTRARRSVFER
jgi:hypothetical protein